jgi:hypothetical protein
MCENTLITEHARNPMTTGAIAHSFSLGASAKLVSESGLPQVFGFPVKIVTNTCVKYLMTIWVGGVIYAEHTRGDVGGRVLFRPLVQGRAGGQPPPAVPGSARKIE